MIEVASVAVQIVDLIDMEARRGNMLPKTAAEIEESIRKGKAFWLEIGDQVVSYAAVYEWNGYLEIGSVVTHKDFRHRGLAAEVTAKAIEAARRDCVKPIIALTNSQSTHLFLKLGFRVESKLNGASELWEPCQDSCAEYHLWPACHCQFLILPN